MDTADRVMIPMEITNPVWSAKDSSYMFKISGSPLFLNVQSFASSAAENVPQPTPAQLESLLDRFIEKTSKHFATPLRTSNILPRLKHIWNVVEHLNPETFYMFQWSPVAMIVKSKEFCLVWSSVAQPCAPVIPSDFLNLSAPSRSGSPAPESRDLRTIQLQPQTSLVEHDVPMADVNDPRLMTLEYENSPISVERKRIREARLRAALANLRAERLTEKYYQKYGTNAEDGSSDLSSDSGEED